MVVCDLRMNEYNLWYHQQCKKEDYRKCSELYLYYGIVLHSDMSSSYSLV